MTADKWSNPASLSFPGGDPETPVSEGEYKLRSHQLRDRLSDGVKTGVGFGTVPKAGRNYVVLIQRLPDLVTRVERSGTARGR